MTKMSKRVDPRILFFTASAVVTQEEYDAADALGRGVMFRNGSLALPANPESGITAVAGKVPSEGWPVNYPVVATAEDVIAVVRGDRKASVATGNDGEELPQTFPLGFNDAGSAPAGGWNPQTPPTAPAQAPASPPAVGKNPSRKQPAASSAAAPVAAPATPAAQPAPVMPAWGTPAT